MPQLGRRLDELEMRVGRMLLFFAAILSASAAFAQVDYPSSPIRLVVPFPPGGATDVLGRIAARIARKPHGKATV